MQNVSKHLSYAVILSQMTHIFCCGLPALFSVLSLLSGLGLVGVMPSSMEHVHESMHEWERPILFMSGAVLIIGWALHMYSRKLDCTKTASCSHEPCAPKKKQSARLLLVATFLFTINVLIILTH